MGKAAWAVPAGVLGGIVLISLIFIWWWFPRQWKKGTAEEMAAVMEDKRQREARIAEAVANGDLEAGQVPTEPARPTFVYQPPAYTSY